MGKRFPDGRSAIDALPSSVRVGPFDYAIAKWDAAKAISSPNWGECSPSQMTIGLTADMPSRMRAVDTFVHEVGHAIYSAYGMEDEDKEERIVLTFARGWSQVFRDNPALLDWIARCV